MVWLSSRGYGKIVVLEFEKCMLIMHIGFYSVLIPFVHIQTSNGGKKNLVLEEGRPGIDATRIQIGMRLLDLPNASNAKRHVRFIHISNAKKTQITSVK